MLLYALAVACVALLTYSGFVTLALAHVLRINREYAVRNSQLELDLRECRHGGKR